MFAKVCSNSEADLTEFNEENDHLHLLAKYPPQVQVSRLVNNLKGVSSRRLRQHFPMRTHDNHLWSPPYFAVSCGDAPLPMIRQYVKNQQRPN